MPSWTKIRIGKGGAITFEYVTVLGGTPFTVGGSSIGPHGGTINPVPTPTPTPTSTTYYRLLEDGSEWLLETDNNWLLEQSPPFILLESSGFWLLETGGFIELEGTTADG